jgi:ribosomal protein L11 methyltransferase
VDNDPQAVLATRSNIESNQEATKIIVLHTDDEGQLEKVDFQYYLQLLVQNT